jgi:hypothetical protein
MKLFLSLLLLCSISFSQEQAPKDTSIATSFLKQRLESQREGLQNWLRNQSWYEKFYGYQMKMTAINSQLDLLYVIKDTLVTVPKEILKE